MCDPEESGELAGKGRKKGDGMMMICPEYYAKQWGNTSYPELIRERDDLIGYLREFEEKETAGDRSDLEWRYSPSPDVRYQMQLEYLAELCRLMKEKYNEEYVWGKRTLKQDADEEKKADASEE